MNNLNDMDICPLLTGNTMEVTRKTKIETDTFELGDIIKFKLADGQKVKAMACDPPLGRNEIQTICNSVTRYK